MTIINKPSAGDTVVWGTIKNGPVIIPLKMYVYPKDSVFFKSLNKYGEYGHDHENIFKNIYYLVNAVPITVSSSYHPITICRENFGVFAIVQYYSQEGILYYHGAKEQFGDKSKVAAYLATLSVKNKEYDARVSLHPNPAQDVLYLTGVGNSGQVEIIDVMGRIRLSQTLSDEKIDISTLQAGVYLLKINNITYKFVKN